MKTLQFSWMALLCLILNTNQINAQDSTFINTTEQYDYTQLYDLTHDKAIDINSVPFAVLYNRVFGWSGLAKTRKIEHLTKDRLMQAWQDLYRSSYQFGSCFTFTALQDYLVQYELNDTVPIIAFDYKYSIIDSSNLLHISIDSNANYTDTNGNTMALKPNQFLEKHIKMLGLYTEKVIQNQPITLLLDDKLLLQNTDNTISKVTIYDGTNLIATLLPNIEQNITMLKSGNIILTIKCELNNGETFESTQTIIVEPYKKIRGVCGNETHHLISSTIPFQGYNESIATTTHADYHVFYKFLNNDPTNCDNKITKPIIFLDGFDPQNSRNYKDIYNKYLTTDQITKKGNVADNLRLMGYDLIILNFPRIGQTIDLENGAKLKIPIRVKNSNNTNVLRINRDGGTDFIERNSMVFIELVKEINTEVATNASQFNIPKEQLVIIGPSMGGQIARYGLAYMEKKYSATNINTWQHNCRLYVSFDSPHEGANIAIGAQQALDHLGNFYGNFFAANNLQVQIKSVAARQLLIEQLDGLNGTASFYDKYYNGTTNNGFDALNTNGLPGSHGYPMNCRKITLVNGSGDGLETLFAGAEVAYVHANAPLNTYAFIMHLRFMEPTGGVNRTFEGYNLRKIGYLAGWNLNLFTSTTTSGIITNGIHLKRKLTETNWNFIDLFPGGNWWNFFLPWQHFHHDKYLKYSSDFTTTNNNTHGCLDAAPGGLIDVVGQVLTNVRLALDTALLKNELSEVTHFTNSPFSCFIPTISGLGFKNSNFKWNKKISDRNLICSNGGEIYFDNYFAPKTNQGHVQITDESYAWLKEELAKGHKGPECVPICATEITGPEFPCVGSHNVYNVNVDPSLAPNISWYIYGDVTSTQLSATSALVSPLDLAKYTKQNIIMVTITNPCGADIVLTKTLQIVPPSTIDPLRIKVTLSLDPTDPCNLKGVINYYTNATLTTIQPWSSLMPEQATFMYSYDGLVYFANPSGAALNTMNLQCVKSNATMWVKVFSRCGLVGVFKSNKFVPTPAQTNSNCSCKKETILPDEEANYKIEVYPNPTNDKWQVLVNDFSNIKYADFKLYDLNGKQVWSNYVTEFHYSNVTVPAANLPKGIYLLRVVTDRQTNSIKLLKE